VGLAEWTIVTRADAAAIAGTSAARSSPAMTGCLGEQIICVDEPNYRFYRTDMRLSDDVARVFRDYPRIYFACHRRHVRDPKSGVHVSARQVSIMDHLDAERPMMLSDLADHLGVTPATMSIAVGQLVQQGYVTRVLDPVDRRKVQLRLTHAGVRVCAANSVLEPALVEDMLGQLSDRDRRAALHGLELLGRAAVAAQQQRSRATKRGRKAAS
jgi:MarR family transcriptional regulator, organic hydroperoxide resistance regulator